MYGYVLNSLGPATPFLKSQLKLSYTLAGLHFSAFALWVAAGQSAWVTVGVSFWMGAIGSLLSSVVPGGLADEHGDNRAIALTELNLIAAVGSAAAALAVGWFSYTVLSWYCPC